MLRMTNLSKVYRTHMIETHALRGFDIHVSPGEFVAVTGPSGSGKTTFLNIAGLLEEFTGGDYVLDGVNVKGMDDNARSKLRNEKLGFIFQGFNLIPDLNLFDNVDVPLRYRGFNAAERKRRIEEALGRVGLSSRIRHYPAEWSGGQQQRVAIARALAGAPKLLLADEPTGNLDSQMARAWPSCARAACPAPAGAPGSASIASNRPACCTWCALPATARPRPPACAWATASRPSTARL